MYNMGYKPLTVPGTHTHISLKFVQGASSASFTRRFSSRG